MTRWIFYLRYALRNLVRSRRWSVFAIFCIAAGVATVVALRSLGLAIADSLVSNLRSTNHGDINIAVGGGGLEAFFEAGEATHFTARALLDVEAWAEQNNVIFDAYTSVSTAQVTAQDGTRVGRPQFVNLLLVNPATFPTVDEVLAIDPAGVPLDTLLTEPRSIVVSRNLAESENLHVGDSVRVSGTSELYTVRGIVSSDQESNMTTIFSTFFGFAYVNLSEAESLGIDPHPNIITVALPEDFPERRAMRALQRDLGIIGDYTTVSELLRRNSTIGDVLSRFITFTSLGGLLIGGVGIINTMLVMVGRRSMEIATLKTFGLKGRQIAALFLAEAFWMGLFGCLLGSLFGVAMGGLVNQYGEAFIQQRLAFRVYPEAILYGLGLGMVITLVFGLIPVLTAVRVRPASILRPNETVLPAVGCLQSLLGIFLVIFGIGTIISQIAGLWWVGYIVITITLMILAVLVGLLWVVVWLVSKLPAFKSVDLRLALRNLASRRLRTATTLLVLSTGMFTLSSITFVGEGTRQIMQFQLEEGLNGNVLVFPYANLLSQDLGQMLLRGQMEGIDGIERYRELAFYNLRLLAVNGEQPNMMPSFLNPDDMPDEVRREMTTGLNMMTIIYDPNDATPALQAGRALTAEDDGKNVMVMAGSSALVENGSVTIGSIVRLRVGRTEEDFEVVGIYAAQGMSGVNTATTTLPRDVIGDMDASFTLNTLRVTPEKLNQVLLDLTALVPPVLAIDITFIDSLLSRLIDRFAALPTLVGLLALMSSAVIMANSVALSTLERRKQIGVLKAIGLKNRRVLLIMLLENTFVGLLGSLIGLGLSGLMVAIMTALGQGAAIPIPADARPTAIALVFASVLIAWVATAASASQALNERVTTVLRYE